MEYTAFISYSHAADAAVAAAIQSGLYGFAKAWHRRRALRIFRDKTTLAANAALWPSLEKALSASEFLLLLASPKSAQSPWIEREVAWWIANRPLDKLLVVLTAGDIVWDATRGDFDWERTTALPAVLQGRLSQEPLYVDLRSATTPESLNLRNSKFREAVLDLASPLRGVSKDDLDGEDVRQFRRRRRIAWSVGTALLILSISFGSAWWYALQQRDLAVARDLAGRSSLALTEGNVELGALLAIEAIRRRPSLESDSAIRRALGSLATPAAALEFREPVTDIDADGPGRRIVIGGEQRLIIWDSVNGNVIQLPSKTPVHVVRISDDGQRVLVIDADKKVDLWEGGEKRRTPGTMEPIHAAGLSGDGRRAVLVDARGYTYLWNVDSGMIRRLDGPAVERAGERAEAAISVDGARVIVSAPRMIRVWTSGAITSERVPPDEWNATDLVLASDASRIVAYDLRTNFIDVRDPLSGARVARLFAGSRSQNSFLVNADGRRIVSSEIGGSAINVYDVDSRTSISVVHSWGALGASRTISGDGNRVVIIDQHTQMVEVRDITGEQVLNLGDKGAAGTRTIGVSGDGFRLLVNDDTAGIRVIEAASGREVWNWNVSGGLRQAKLSGDGRRVLVVGNDGKSQALAVDAGSEARPIVFEENSDYAAIGADGRRAVAVNQDAAGVINHATARIWNAKTGTLLKTTPVARRVHIAALSSDGERLLMGFKDTLWTWALNKWWGQIRQFDIGGDVQSASLNPDGTLLAAVRDGGVLQVWEIDSRQPVLYLAGLDPVSTMAFSLDGRSLVTVSRTARGTVLRRHLFRPDDLVAEVCNRIARNLTEEEWTEYIGGARRPSCPQFR